MMLHASWDPILVGISFLVAFIASFVALDSAAKIAASNKKAALFWRITGGATLGKVRISRSFLPKLTR